MKPYIHLLTILLLLFSTSVPEATAQPGSSGFPDNPSYTLYPVTEFNADMVETIPYMTWQIPELPGGGIPPGLLGYRIYRDGDSLTYLSDPACMTYYDGSQMEPGMHVYALTAYYDLTPYGFPGLFEESEAAEDSIYYTSCPLPFGENWDQASFAYNEWIFEPSQGNWLISTAHGNPVPTAVFDGTPAISNYSHRLISRYFVTAYYFCADIVLEFDYRLEDIAAGSTEKLIVEIEYDDSWHTLLELTNNGSTEWIHQVIVIPEVYPFNCRIGFRAEGENSSNISGWMVDNILFDARCHPPLNTTLDFSGGNIVTLTWEPPCESVDPWIGSFEYYVMRTDSSGLPPYTQVSPVITDTFFNNYLAPGELSGHFRYYIIAQHNYDDGYYNSWVCSSFGDTVSYNPSLGTTVLHLSELVIYPNPAADKVTIKGLSDHGELSITDGLGNTIMRRILFETDQLILDVSAWKPGIYLVKYTTQEGTAIRKLSILH